MLIRNSKTRQHALINYKMLNMIPESEGVWHCGCGVVQKRNVLVILETQWCSVLLGRKLMSLL
jgi:hypothetical protein